MDFFPYEPRLHQSGLVDLVDRTARADAHAIIESGTGTGKTVCALAGTLPSALARSKRILYLTRTNSQGRQVVVEFRRIRERRPDLLATLVALQGRTHLCPLRSEDEEMAKANAEELALMCRDRCRGVELERQGSAPPAGITPCRFFRASDSPRLEPFLAWCRERTPTAEELVEEARARGVCPYEATKALVAEATVIVAPYVYVFHPGLRRAFLSWANARMQDFFVVVDEAHNLPDFARGLASADLSRPQLSRARDEALRHGNPDVGGARLLAFLAALDGIVVRAASELLVPGEEDALIPPDWLETELMGAFAKTSVALRKIVGSLEEYAEGVRDAKRREGKVPRSYVGGVARFLRIHLEGEEAYARLVCAEPAAATESAGDTHRAGRPGSFAGGTRNQRLLATPQPSREDGRAASPELSPEFPAPDAAFPAGERTGPEGAGASARARLECFALDPSSVTEILLNAAGSLHMSGTLRPLEAYRETVGVPSNTPCYLVPSALPPENRLLLIHPEVTTRYEEVRRFPDMWRKIGAELASIRASTPRNVMVFVPSHDVAGRLRSFLPTAIVEEPGASQGDLMEAVRRFKGARGATFIAVIGGRVAEGLDFPDDELEVAAIVGLPFPKPTARQRALERYYDARTHGRGFEIASRAPMLRRVLQAAGRVVRSPTDRGVVVVLDKRASLFADEFGEVRIERKPGEAIIAFFRGEASAVPPFARVEREDS